MSFAIAAASTVTILISIGTVSTTSTSVSVRLLVSLWEPDVPVATKTDGDYRIALRYRPFCRQQALVDDWRSSRLQTCGSRRSRSGLG